MLTAIINNFWVLAGGSLGLWAAALWLIKKFFAHQMAKDLANHTANLEATNSREAEKFNSQLKIAEYEHQMRFAKVYDRQARIVSALYKSLSQAEIYLIDSVREFRYDSEPTTAEQDAKFVKYYNKSYKLYLSNRIYLPLDLCKQIEDFFRKIKMMRAHDQIFNPFTEGRPQRDQREFDEWMENRKKIETEIPKIREALENKFRELLSGADKGKDAK